LEFKTEDVPKYDINDICLAISPNFVKKQSIPEVQSTDKLPLPIE